MTWAILCLVFPLAALALLGIVTPLRRSGRPGAWVSILAMAGSLVSAIGAGALVAALTVAHALAANGV